jgi:predicted ATPase
VAEICSRLDHLPLAIELAASRIKLLPERALLQRLDQRLKVLAGGPRDLPERQRTLRAAIDWSFELLEPEQRRLFARLAVFAGGRSLDAVEQVCDPDSELDVLDGLMSLIDKSLLRQEESESGEPRFVMLETIHEYARERLEESGEAQAVRARHARYFLSLVQEALVDRHRSWRMLNALETEHSNIRAALAWAEGADPAMAMVLAAKLWRFWDLRAT